MKSFLDSLGRCFFLGKDFSKVQVKEAGTHYCCDDSDLAE